MNKRLQLTLFVEAPESEVLEAIRRKFNSVQYALIKSHITLCRESELEMLEAVLANLENTKLPRLCLEFERPVRFSDRKGVLLPATGGREDFQKLRNAILKGVLENPGTPEPHLTLMHPRNSTCTDEMFEAIEKCDFPAKITFRKISLIEQVNGGKWGVLKEFDLAANGW
jgi:2'-5' RNA ligase superfamily